MVELFTVSLIWSTVRLSTPLILAALGGLFSERSGVINIALEGMMLAGAFTGAAVTYATGSPWAGLLGAILAGVAIVFAIAECIHIVVLGPLVADMAPAHLLGRYLSLYSLTFTGSLALGPAIGGLLLQTDPDAIWWGGALAALLAGAVLLRLGDRIPDTLDQAPSRLVSAPEAA